tara:strand:+ start:19900 stop:20325 length:426 start_codon:yes stop_codon:yes gene_type:complete
MSYDTTKHNLWWGSFSDAERHMMRHENRNNSLKIMHNTKATRYGNTIDVELHWTNVYRIEKRHDVGDEFAHSVITLNTGGYRTVTTKDRINRFLPIGYRVIQRNFNWILQRKETMWGGMNQDKWYDQELFYDGMQIRLPIA